MRAAAREQFWRNASEILTAAEQVAGSGQTASPMTIVVGPGGEVHLLSDCDWPLDSLRLTRGAEMVYRVGQQGGVVRVEGRSRGRCCLLQSEAPRQNPRHGPGPDPRHVPAALPLPAPPPSAPHPWQPCPYLPARVPSRPRYTTAAETWDSAAQPDSPALYA